MMEAACHQAVSAHLANADGGTPPPSTLFSRQWHGSDPAELARLIVDIFSRIPRKKSQAV